eukprot:3372147-Rhodomonas_salina.1
MRRTSVSCRVWKTEDTSGSREEDRTCCEKSSSKFKLCGSEKSISQRNQRELQLVTIKSALPLHLLSHLAVPMPGFSACNYTHHACPHLDLKTDIDSLCFQCLYPDVTSVTPRTK